MNSPQKPAVKPIFLSAPAVQTGLPHLHSYTKMIYMRTNLNIDGALLEEAQRLSGARTKTETVELGLRALVAQQATRRLALLKGLHPEVEAPHRRRPDPQSQ